MEPAMLAFEVLEQVWPLLDEERAIPGIVLDNRQWSL
jgi:hypothetical protein